MFYWLHVPLSRPAEVMTTRHAVIRFTPAKARSDDEADAVAFDIICMYKAEHRKRFFNIVRVGIAYYKVGGG